MIQIKYGQFEVPLFEAVSRLKAQRLPAQTAYKVHKFSEAMEKVAKSARAEHTALLKKFIVLDEKGLPKPQKGAEIVGPNGEKHQEAGRPFYFDPAEREQEYQTELAVFLEKTAEIDREKIPLAELGDIGLAPSDIEHLEIFVDFEAAAPSGKILRLPR